MEDDRYTKMLNALKYIQNVCEENQQCRNCPFYHEETQYQYSYCGISKTPSSWRLNEELPKWKAFKE